MLHETIRDRLRAEIARAGISAVELARQAGVKTSFIYDILNGKSTNPSTVKLAQVAKALGVGLAYLAGADEEGGAATGGDSIAVPLLHVSASGSAGSMLTDPLKRYYFRTDWVRTRLRASPQALRVVRVNGDGMAPTFLDGDIVLLHTAERSPSPPGVFVLFDGMGLALKRLEPAGSASRLRILADNPRYSPQERALSEVEIIGRVVWFARET